MSDPVFPPVVPLRFEPAFETPEADEAQTTLDMQETLLDIARTMADSTGHARRAVHAKSHGLLRGELQVLGDLPPDMVQGIFARPCVYPVVIRMSTPPGEELPDNVSTPRGLALKVIGVDGERLPGSEGVTTQDFVMINGPAFAAPTAKAFLKNLQLLAKTTDKSPGGKQFLSAILQGVEKVVEAVGSKSGTLIALGGHPETHPLGETYFTQAPMLYGPYMAKISVVPVSPALTALTDAPLAMRGKPDALRNAVIDFFADPAAAAVWELRVQLCTDLETMPIEDATVVWPEDQSPYVTVARLTVAAQTGWSEAREAAVDDGMAFSPWHGVAAHRPLGSIMRVRKAVYDSSAEFRSQRNGCPIHEPRSLQSFPVA